MRTVYIIFLLVTGVYLGGYDLYSQNHVKTIDVEDLGLKQEQAKKLCPTLLHFMVPDKADRLHWESLFPVRITKSGETIIDVIVVLHDGKELGENESFVLLQSIGNYAIIRINPSELSVLAAKESVKYISPSYYLNDMTDWSISSIKADQVWNASTDEIPLTGDSVLIGIIDSGIDYFHPDFIDNDHSAPLGEWNSRIKYIWDHKHEHQLPPDTFDYGYELTHSMITKSINSGVDLLCYDTNGHGTHVAGIAAGDGSASDFQYVGVAPESNLIICNALRTIDATIDAISWMVTRANDLEMPLVINFSRGNEYGPRDGNSIHDNMINDVIGKHDVIFVVAAGNERNKNKHTSFSVPEGGEHISNLKISAHNNDEVYPVRYYFDHTDDYAIQIRPEGDEDWYPDEPYRFDSSFFLSFSDPNIGSYNLGSNTYPDSDNYFALNFINTSPNITWQIRFIDIGEGSNKKMHGYVETGAALAFLNDVDMYSTVLSPSSASEAISVSSYVSKNTYNSIDGPQPPEYSILNHISSFSSKGPLRNETSPSKPDIAAPGQFVTSSLSSSVENIPDDKWLIPDDPDFNYYVSQGTSMAAPHVTGAIALLLQSFPELNHTQVKTILQENTSPHSTGDETDFGKGRLNILAAYQSMAGFDYITLSDAITEKLKNAYDAFADGLPVQPVQSDWKADGLYKQRLTHGSLFLDEQSDLAYWLGEEIWEGWLALETINSLMGLPQSSQQPDLYNTNHPTVYFDNGKMYWDGTYISSNYFFPDFEVDVTYSESLPQNVLFTDQSNLINAEVTGWLWDFGDGNTSTEQHPTHTYFSNGSFDVTLTIFDNDYGFTKTKTDLIHIETDHEGYELAVVEYFFNADPGYGNGTIHFLTPDQHVQNQTFHIDISDLDQGYNYFYVRVMDLDLTWSLTNVRSFYKENLHAQPQDIAQAEYFINNDPGTGNATQIPITAANQISDQGFMVDISDLDPGFHHLYVRTKDENDVWSLTNVRPFYVEILYTSPQQIVETEYFIGSDPGWGMATSIPVVASHDIADQVFYADIGGLTHGDHHLMVRAKDENNRWSLTNVTEFTVEEIPCMPPGNLLATAGQTSDEVVLSWTPNSNENQWDILYGLQGFDPNNGGYLLTGITQNPYTIASLELETAYDLYVRGICDDQIASVWAGPVTFETEITAIPIDHLLVSLTIESPVITCFDALQTITTGGTGHFIVEPGAIVDLIAGENIIMLPGTHLQEGSDVQAYITTDDSFCGEPDKHFLAIEEAGDIDRDQDSEKQDDETDVEELEEAGFFEVYPNPTRDRFTLELHQYDTGSMVMVEIYSMHGQRIKHREVQSGQQHVFNLEGQQPGIYLIRVMQGENVGVERIVKR